MSSSPLVGKLAEALAKAQADMGPVTKGSANPFYKSKYADLGSVIEAIRKPLTTHALSYVQYVREDGENTYLVTRLMHSSGEWMEGEMRLIPAKKDMQAMGSAITYAKRYGLTAMVGLGEEDDDGNSNIINHSPKNSLSSVPKPKTETPQARGGEAHQPVVGASQDSLKDPMMKKAKLTNLIHKAGWNSITVEQVTDQISNKRTKKPGELSDSEFQQLCGRIENEIAMNDVK